jgi:hypothetical protein
MMASSIPLPQDESPYADRRAHPRVPTALPAFLQADGERHSVQVLDLSAGGARVSCALSLPSGTAVVLDCGGLSRGATVRWQNGELVGLCFDSELDERDVSALAERSKALAARIKTAE